uniref:LPS-assembly lipoprotein LptE n=1 Tax=uncultured Thiotrichaceae bacterium TaxID=298394 RepID=A0A6S6U0J6_9GAMM|nr:MAG: Unknown protein [uncultured Thiotrichaceae bacterium]
MISQLFDRHSSRIGRRAAGLVLITFFLVISAVQGCATGFKPRGADSLTYAPLKGMSVLLNESGKQSGFTRILEDGLHASGAALVTESAPGVIVLKINELEEDKTVSAYSAVRQVREFNHYIELSFLAVRQPAGGKAKQVEALVRAERVQIYDSEYVLGAAEEERIIKNELRVEVVRLLALRIAVLK